MASDSFNRRLHALEERQPAKPRRIRIIVAGNAYPEDADDVVVLTPGRPIRAADAETGKGS
jgi:hypothetical protein